jgi:predicted RNA-binding protein
MCQMSVVIEENGEQKVIMENVTRLESTDGNISVSTLFEEPKIIPSSFVKTIDFTGGTVLLSPISGGN